MGVHLLRKSRALVTLFVAGVLLPFSAPAQLATGSLSGRLTDAHSSPLENVTIRLRNEATGAELTAISSRGGRYGFKNLPEGEYTLDTPSARGGTRFEGIKVSARHQSHVQAVIDPAGNGAPASCLRIAIFIPALRRNRKRLPTYWTCSIPSPNFLHRSSASLRLSKAQSTPSTSTCSLRPGPTRILR